MKYCIVQYVDEWKFIKGSNDTVQLVWDLLNSYEDCVYQKYIIKYEDFEKLYESNHEKPNIIPSLNFKKSGGKHLIEYTCNFYHELKYEEHVSDVFAYVIKFNYLIGLSSSRLYDMYINLPNNEHKNKLLLYFISKKTMAEEIAQNYINEMISLIK